MSFPIENLSDVDTCIKCGAEIREYDLDGYREWLHEDTDDCPLDMSVEPLSAREQAHEDEAIAQEDADDFVELTRFESDSMNIERMLDAERQRLFGNS